MRLKWTVIGAVVVGATGFVLGFFGPILLTPGANQGPLLGICITGPGGFVLGALAGCLLAPALEARFAKRPDA